MSVVGPKPMRWEIPVQTYPDFKRAHLAIHILDGQVVFLPPASLGGFVLPISSEGPLSEALREARAFSQRDLRRQGPS